MSYASEAMAADGDRLQIHHSAFTPGARWHRSPDTPINLRVTAIGNSLARLALPPVAVFRPLPSLHFDATPAGMLLTTYFDWQTVLLVVLVAIATSVLTRYFVRRAKSDPAERETNFRDLVEAFPEAIVVTQNETLVYANPSGLKLLGAEQREKLESKGISEISTTDSVDSTRGSTQHNPGTNPVTSLRDRTALSLGGAPEEVESISIPITWRGSPATGTIARDDRERKRSQQRLQEYEKVVESLAEMIVVVDRDYRYLIANRAFLTYRGLTRDEVIGHFMTDIVEPATFESIIRKRLEECFRGNVVKYEMTYEYPRLGERDISVSYFPIEDNGEVLRVACILLDITVRKRTERAFRQSQAEATRVNRVVTMGELTSTIAHEINQPLTAVVTDVSASLRWLSQSPPNLEEARAGLRVAIREANRASDVVARIRSLLTHTPPSTQRLDIVQAVLDVLAMVSNELQQEEVSVRTEFAPNTPKVRGDLIQLQQVLLNLINNSVDAMSAIHDRRRELFFKSSRDLGGVLIEVRDNGIGLDPDRANRIFEPFFTTKQQGIGMGLSISRSIVEAHGGRLWAAPNSPHGTIFYFTLPQTGDRHE